jgi:hypothetical protein
MPTAEDGSWTDNGDGYWTSSNITTFQIDVGAEYTDLGDSIEANAFLKIVEPISGYNLYLRGDSNNDFYDNFAGNNPNSANKYRDFDGYWMGKYTLNIMDESGISSRFISVFQLCNDGTYNTMSSCERIVTSSWRGVVLDSNRVILFSDNPVYPNGGTFTVTGLSGSSLVYIALKDDNYTVDGGVGAVTVAGEISLGQGIGFFTISGNGTYTITP